MKRSEKSAQDCFDGVDDIVQETIESDIHDAIRTQHSELSVQISHESTSVDRCGIAEPAISLQPAEKRIPPTPATAEEMLPSSEGATANVVLGANTSDAEDVVAAARRALQEASKVLESEENKPK